MMRLNSIIGIGLIVVGAVIFSLGFLDSIGDSFIYRSLGVTDILLGMFMIEVG